jgi:flavodoxin I
MRQPTTRDEHFQACASSKAATTASFFALGLMVGAIGLVASQQSGLVDSSVNTLGGTSALLGKTATPKTFTTAACYGDGYICTALLSAFNPKQFQQISSLKSTRSERRLWVPDMAPTSTGTARAASEQTLLGDNRKPRARTATFPRQAARGARQAARSGAVQMSVGLYYSTTTGNTETIAGYIADLVGVEAQDPADVSKDDIMAHDAIIVGAPTWHTGADTERSGTTWDEWLYNELPNMDFTGKKVAIFGVGDSSGYGENFCDATGELYDCFTKQGATVIGGTSADKGFDYEESKGVVDGKFVGMPFDEDNYSDESEERAGAWVEQLKKEGLIP